MVSLFLVCDFTLSVERSGSIRSASCLRAALYLSSFSLTEGRSSPDLATPLSVCISRLSESCLDGGFLSVLATIGFSTEFISLWVGFPTASSTMRSPLVLVGTSRSTAARSAMSFSALVTIAALSTLPSSKRSTIL